MIRLDINSDEKQVLIEALQNYISELRMEIVDTDSSAFREKLKSKKRTLNRILHMIEGEKVEPEV
ncbi:MAG TPA: hypothetical protein VKA34_22005 [Balneolales bacterium]|nr:hypothetical protein [Balneolales bacterium]